MKRATTWASQRAPAVLARNVHAAPTPASLLPPPLAAALGLGGLIPFCALSAPGQRALDVRRRLGPARAALDRPSLNGTELQVCARVGVF
jgi:hypothetical protein